MESKPVLAFRFPVYGEVQRLKVFLSALMILFFFAGNVEAADLNADSGKVFVAKRFITPPRLRQPFVPFASTPKKTYPPRVPARPKPHYLPHVPKHTYDNR